MRIKPENCGIKYDRVLMQVIVVIWIGLLGIRPVLFNAYINSDNHALYSRRCIATSSSGL